MWKSCALLLALLFCLFMMAGCAADPPVEAQGKLRIVATTTIMADLVRSLGGDLVEVTALMGPGVDPHVYQASAGDVTAMRRAEAVLYSGLHLEGKMGDLFASLTVQGKAVICAADGLDPASLLYADEGVPDPHFWMNVASYREAARYVSGQLTRIDPENADGYALRLAAYCTELDELEAYIQTRAEELPDARRVLVTAHDAFGYFGSAYGLVVKGLQGISTDAEAGTADVSTLARYITERNIRAIFVETSISPKTMQALQAAVQARGHAVQIGGTLYGDSLGDAASLADTYAGAMRANIDTIVNALK